MVSQDVSSLSRMKKYIQLPVVDSPLVNHHNHTVPAPRHGGRQIHMSYARHGGPVPIPGYDGLPIQMPKYLCTLTK